MPPWNFLSTTAHDSDVTSVLSCYTPERCPPDGTEDDQTARAFSQTAYKP